RESFRRLRRKPLQSRVRGIYPQLACYFPVRFLSFGENLSILGRIRRSCARRQIFPVFFPCSQEIVDSLELEMRSNSRVLAELLWKKRNRFSAEIGLLAGIIFVSSCRSIPSSSLSTTSRKTSPFFTIV